MMIVVRVLVHGAWIVALLLGRPYLAVALLLFAFLCYVKVFKFRQQLRDLTERGGHPQEKASLQNALQRWRALTFLKDA